MLTFAMALSEADIEQFIEALQHNAELRERVRAAILSDDFLALPGLVRANTEAIAALTERMNSVEVRLERVESRLERVESRLERVESRLERVEKRVDDLAGKVGNLDGEVLELKFPTRAARRFARLFRDVRLIEDSEFARRLQDNEASLAPSEWDDVLLLDALLEATSRADGSKVFLAVEISRTVLEDDVVRADRRARLVAQLGYVDVRACVDGDAIEPTAKALAERLDVLALVQREAQPAA